MGFFVGGPRAPPNPTEGASRDSHRAQDSEASPRRARRRSLPRPAPARSPAPSGRSRARCPRARGRPSPSPAPEPRSGSVPFVFPLGARVADAYLALGLLAYGEVYGVGLLSLGQFVGAFELGQASQGLVPVALVVARPCALCAGSVVELLRHAEGRRPRIAIGALAGVFAALVAYGVAPGRHFQGGLPPHPLRRRPRPRRGPRGLRRRAHGGAGARSGPAADVDLPPRVDRRARRDRGRERPRPAPPLPRVPHSRPRGDRPC